jgi:NAD(P)-dependent dehydrogenase (short-subunit alcohol dehydrogenase family)
MRESKGVAGRVAIVTGGGRGMGRAMALGLARAGAQVAITAARSPEEIEAVAREGGTDRILPLLGDVGREVDCARVVADIEARFGPVSILVNNAGRGMRYVSERFMSEPTRFWETAPETWRMVIDTNVNGPFFMSRAVAPGMIARGWGRIVNVTMNYETMRRKGFSPYGPSKAALESETVIWAQDLQGTGVTVNALLPGGATRTGMVPESVSEEVRHRLLPPEVMVPPLLWLASEDSDGLTGQRFNAARWDPSLTAAAAAARAVESAGWSSFRG